jgi:branched-chain amino acid transport system ATP-binding protein
MMLRVKDLQVGYGGLKALRGISLELEKASIVTIIGPNGAGKSTALKTVCGTLKPTAGEIWFEKQRIDGLPTDEIVGLRIAHVPEGRRIFPHLTVLENLKMGAYLIKDRKTIEKNLSMTAEFFPILDVRKAQDGGSLSGGEQQMLAIARALMSNPKLILMDEPTLGLSPLLCGQLIQIISDLNKEQEITILLVEQNARIALNLAEWGYILESGRIALGDSCDVLKENEKVKQIYLGE